MKIQLIKETDIYGEVWWLIKQDETIAKAYSDEDEAKEKFKEYLKNLKLGYPKTEIIQEETI